MSGATQATSSRATPVISPESVSNTKDKFPDKIAALQNALNQLGYMGINLLEYGSEHYDKGTAKTNRQNAFEFLDPNAYPNAILETP